MSSKLVSLEGYPINNNLELKDLEGHPILNKVLDIISIGEFENPGPDPLPKDENAIDLGYMNDTEKALFTLACQYLERLNLAGMGIANHEMWKMIKKRFAKESSKVKNPQILIHSDFSLSLQPKDKKNFININQIGVNKNGTTINLNGETP